MRVTLNKKAMEFAKEMIHQGKFSDKRGRADAAHAKPTSIIEEEFLKTNTWENFGHWYLGVHNDRPQNNRARYEFPIGDFQEIHRSDLLEVQKKAHSLNYGDIANGAQELVDLIDKKMHK